MEDKDIEERIQRALIKYNKQVMPKHLPVKCAVCDGFGKFGDTGDCRSCDGKGYILVGVRPVIESDALIEKRIFDEAVHKIIGKNVEREDVESQLAVGIDEEEWTDANIDIFVVGMNHAKNNARFRLTNWFWEDTDGSKK